MDRYKLFLALGAFLRALAAGLLLLGAWQLGGSWAACIAGAVICCALASEILQLI